MMNGWMSRKLGDSVDFMSPRYMGLMGLASGLLGASGASPREITLGEGMGRGIEQGMYGMQQGLGMQMQGQHIDLLRQQQQSAQQKAAKQLEVQDYLTRATKEIGTNDPVALGRHLMASGYQELIPIGLKMMGSKTAKSFLKGLDDKGNPTFYTGYSTGEVSPTGITPAEKLMQINQGSQIGLANPYTGKIQSTLGVGLTPGEGARLSQSERHFSITNDLAQRNADLARAKFITDTDPEFLGQRAATIAARKLQETNRVTAEADLPKALNEGNKIISQIDDLLSHKGAKMMVGLSNPIGEISGFFPGTDEKDFKLRMGQLDGDKLIAGLPAMRGMGALTEAEGQAIKQSVSRMNASQSEDEFVAAGNDLKRIIYNNMKTAASKAGKQENFVPKPNLEYRGVFGENKSLRNDGWGDVR